MKIGIGAICLILCILGVFCDEVEDIKRAQMLKDEKEDNATLTFQLFDIYDNEMASFMRVRMGDSDIDKLLLIDISSFMTIIYDTETINVTNKISYRGDTYECDIRNKEPFTTYAYHGAYDTQDPEIKEYTIDLEVAHINLDP
jgi:hypothetical protein